MLETKDAVILPGKHNLIIHESILTVQSMRQRHFELGSLSLREEVARGRQTNTRLRDEASLSLLRKAWTIAKRASAVVVPDSRQNVFNSAGGAYDHEGPPGSPDEGGQIQTKTSSSYPQVPAVLPSDSDTSPPTLTPALTAPTAEPWCRSNNSSNRAESSLLTPKCSLSSSLLTRLQLPTITTGSAAASDAVIKKLLGDPPASGALVHGADDTLSKPETAAASVALPAAVGSNNQRNLRSARSSHGSGFSISFLTKMKISPYETPEYSIYTPTATVINNGGSSPVSKRSDAISGGGGSSSPVSKRSDAISGAGGSSSPVSKRSDASSFELGKHAAGKVRKASSFSSFVTSNQKVHASLNPNCGQADGSMSLPDSSSTVTKRTTGQYSTAWTRAAGSMRGTSGALQQALQAWREHEEVMEVLTANSGRSSHERASEPVRSTAKESSGLFELLQSVSAGDSLYNEDRHSSPQRRGTQSLMVRPVVSKSSSSVLEFRRSNKALRL
jgi:hypothetical protein